VGARQVREVSPKEEFPDWHGAGIAASRPAMADMAHRRSLLKGGDGKFRLVPDDVPIAGESSTAGETVEG